MKVDDLVKSATSELGVRFNLVTLFPNLVFAGTLLFLLYAGAPQKAPNLLVLGEIKEMGIMDGVFFIFAVVVFSLIVHPFQILLVRMLEGYWGQKGPGGALARWAVQRRQEAREKMDRKLAKILAKIQTGPDEAQKAALQKRAVDLSLQLQQLYPGAERVLPTRLGNILRAAEDRAGAPYGLDAVTVWPRLYPLIPDGFRERLDNQRLQLDLSVRYSVTFLGTAVGCLILLYAHGWWLLLPLGFLFLAYITYRGALAAALLYGQGIRVAFDLYRFDLLQALHLPLPATLAAEYAANRILCDFLRQGAPANFHYLHKAK